MSTNTAQTTNKPVRQYRNEMVLAILIILLGIGVFLFFKSFFDTSPNSLATEILAAFLGSIITVMITMLLIRQQGTFEHAQETAATNKTKVFEKKLELFREFTRLYVKFSSDGKLEPHELAELEEYALTIFLLTNKIPGKDNKNLGEEVCRFVRELQEHGLPSREATDRVRFVEVMKLMRIELGVAQQVTDSEVVEEEKNEPDGRDWVQELLSYRGYRKD